MPNYFCIALLILVAFDAALPSRLAADEQPAEMSQLTQEVLSWMPSDTESIAVADSFALRSRRDISRFQSLYPRKVATWRVRSIAVGPLNRLDRGDYLEELAGTRVRLAVGAGRRFKFTSSFGAKSYQGCHVIVTSDLSEAGDRFVATLRENANDVRTIIGCEMFVFDTVFKKQIWARDEEWEGVFVARPESNLILCATQEAFLAEVLRRRRDKPEGTIADDSKRWIDVDHSSKAWLVRRFDGPSASSCTINVRPGGRNELHITYQPSIGSPDQVAELADSRWHYSEVDLKPSFRKLSDGSAASLFSLNPTHGAVGSKSGQMLGFLLGLTWGDDFGIRRRPVD